MMLARPTPAARASRRSAFTLIEVLVVVAILVVIAGVGGVIVLRQQQDAYVKVAKTQVEQLGKAAQAFSLANDRLPDSLAELAAPPGGGAAYIEQKMLNDPWNRPYQYAAEGQHNAGKGLPDVWSTGPNPNDPNGMIGNW